MSIAVTAMTQPVKPSKEIPEVPKDAMKQPQTNVSTFKEIKFAKYITTIEWRGARVWYSPGSATVDSVLSVTFSANGIVTWNKQGWEYVTRTPGTYRVTGNRIEINFSYPPYTHFLQGTYDATTGKITGTFTETRAADPGAPPAYAPGTTTGEFNFIKNNNYQNK